MRDVIIPFAKLKESIKLKPPDTFVYQKASYLYDPKAVTTFDRAGRPILKYFVGNMLPITEPMLGQSVYNGKVVSAELFYATFNRGEMKSIIASSQKEPQKWDWLTLVVGLAMGVSIGIVVGLSLYPYFVKSIPATVHVIGVLAATIRR